MSEITTATALRQLDHGSVEMSAWSDDKRKEFCATFDQRARASRYILRETARIIAERAIRRQFLSRKHLRGTIFDGSYGREPYVVQDHYVELRDPLPSPNGYGSRFADTVGGRQIADLNGVAEERAEAVLAELPPLKAAVKIIQPETWKAIVRRDKILEDGQKLVDQLTDLSETIVMAQIDQDMTVGAFRKMVTDRTKARSKIVDKLNALGREGIDLEDRIAKDLYAGIPGLSEAVKKAICDHVDRASALDATCRRVQEQVLFGDSQAALDLLRRFEQDEAAVGADVKAEFAKAMENLKIAARKGTDKAKKSLKKGA